MHVPTNEESENIAGHSLIDSKWQKRYISHSLKCSETARKLEDAARPIPSARCWNLYFIRNKLTLRKGPGKQFYGRLTNSSVRTKDGSQERKTWNYLVTWLCSYTSSRRGRPCSPAYQITCDSIYRRPAVTPTITLKDKRTTKTNYEQNLTATKNVPKNIEKILVNGSSNC